MAKSKSQNFNKFKFFGESRLPNGKSYTKERFLFAIFSHFNDDFVCFKKMNFCGWFVVDTDDHYRTLQNAVPLLELYPRNFAIFGIILDQYRRNVG